VLNGGDSSSDVPTPTMGETHRDKANCNLHMAITNSSPSALSTASITGMFRRGNRIRVAMRYEVVG
jgi:hypothetical protein